MNSNISCFQRCARLRKHNDFVQITKSKKKKKYEQKKHHKSLSLRLDLGGNLQHNFLFVFINK